MTCRASCHDDVLRHADIHQSARINLSLPINVTQGLTSTVAVGGSKGKSFSVTQPLIVEAMQIIINVTVADDQGWVQFSAFGMSLLCGSLSSSHHPPFSPCLTHFSHGLTSHMHS